MPEVHAPDGATKRRRIKGRGPGSGNGKTSGKGHKGQNSRSGGGVRDGFEGGQMPLYRRIARRGFSNYPFKKRWVVVNLLDIDRVYEAGETVDLSSLVKKGLVKRSVELVKILADGEISKKLSFEGLKLSAAAAEKVRSAGGSIAGGSTAETQASVAAESTEDSGEDS